jgi:hypothetical protein
MACAVASGLLAALENDGGGNTIHFSISSGGKVNSLSIGLSKRLLSEASTSGSYL